MMTFMRKDHQLPTLPDNIHPALKDAFGYRLMHASLKYRKALVVILDEFNLSPPELMILRILSDSKPLNQTSLGQELGHDKVTIVRLIDELQELKFVEWIAGEKDKRERFVQITKEGRVVLEKIKKKNQLREKNFLAPLSAAEAAMLKKLIMKL